MDSGPWFLKTWVRTVVYIVLITVMNAWFRTTVLLFCEWCTCMYGFAIMFACIFPPAHHLFLWAWKNPFQLKTCALVLMCMHGKARHTCAAMCWVSASSATLLHVPTELWGESLQEKKEKETKANWKKCLSSSSRYGNCTSPNLVLPPDITQLYVAVMSV